MIKVEGLCFRYKDHSVLDGVSFSAGKGEVICLLGENGAGKTTLFKCIMGFLKTYRGEVLIDNAPLKNLNVKEVAKRIAYIPQAHDPTYNYSVTEIVLMGTTVLVEGYKMPGKDELKGVLEVLESLNISHLASRGYAHLSGGERQLVLIARALAQKSKILIMDEPTANLDYGNQIRVMKQVKELAEQGYTILISTHNPEHALHFADKVLILDEGCTLVYGAPESVLTPEVFHKIYGVDAEVSSAKTSWGEVQVITPCLEGITGK
jgi:iron complex transport system ATP-binding protein